MTDSAAKLDDVAIVLHREHYGLRDKPGWPGWEGATDEEREHFRRIARAAIAALAGQADAEPVAWCDPSDARNAAAFAWPGTAREPRHATPLFTTPPAAIPDALRELVAEWRETAATLRGEASDMDAGNRKSEFYIAARAYDARADELAALIAATKEAP